MNKPGQAQPGEKRPDGFYCKVCDCIVKDSLTFLDHTNGKKHNKNLEISLTKFTDSTFEEVKAMLELKKKERDERAARPSHSKQNEPEGVGEEEDDDDDDDHEEAEADDEDGSSEEDSNED